MCTAYEHIDQEENEVLLVVVADTVIDPRTVVVHSGNTTFASRTMVTLWNFYSIAFLAATLKDGLQLRDFLRLQLVVVDYFCRLSFSFLNFELVCLSDFLLLFFRLELYIVQTSQNFDV